MNKKWQIYETNEQKINQISQKYNLNKLLASIIINRNIKEEDIEVFLNPTRKNFHDPFLMPDMKIAVERIIKAINNKEKIIIYGDYDEGYGLNKPAIDEIVNNKYDLMITVDCGISGIEEIEYANSLGLETIVTDHHEVGDKLPNATAVVDAKRKDNQYPCRDLAGVGVVFKLIQAIRNKT